MKLELFDKPTLEAVRAETLDQLWHEAAQLGALRVGQYSRDGVFNAQITFERASGTKIEAVGKDTSVHVAVAKAINEAREMGAA